MRPLKTLFLLEDLCFGGTQKQNLELALRLDRNIFEPVLLTLTGPTDMDGRAGYIPVFHMGSNRKAAPFFFLRLGAWLEKINPDILVCCTALPNIWGRIWGRVAHVPLVIGSCRGGGAPARQHERFLWRLADHIVCNSYALVEVMRGRGVPENHLTFIPNGVDTGFFHPSPGEKSDPLILCVARLAADKDHRTLIEAFGLVAAQMPGASLRLVGEGPEEAGLRDFVRTNLAPSAAAKIEFAGASADPRPDYHEAVVFALASVREGLPNVILEAMSSGLPVCATNVGGIPYLVENGKSGFLSSPADPFALADNLLRILRDGQLRQGMGAAGRERVEREFSFSSMVAAHQNLFLRLMSQKSMNG